MAQGTTLTIINPDNTNGFDEYVELYFGIVDGNNITGKILLSDNYYHFDGESNGTITNANINYDIEPNTDYGLYLLYPYDGKGSYYWIFTRTSDEFDWASFLSDLNSSSTASTVELDCSTLTWTVDGKESGGGGGSTPVDPVIDPNNRIVTGRIINNMPVIPQKWFKSNLDKCLSRSDVKSTYDTNLDVDYYRSGVGNDNQGIPTLATLVPKSCVTIYYKEFSVGYDNSTFCIELLNDTPNSISISRLVVDVVLCEWGIADNQFLVTNTLDTLSYSSINVKSGTTKTLYPNDSNNHPVSFNPSWTFRHLDQRLTFSISATLNGCIDTMKLYTTGSSGSMSEKSSFIDVQWTDGINNKTFGLDIYGSGNTQSDRNLLIGNSIDSNPGATKIYFDLGWY